mgnify:FL=1
MDEIIHESNLINVSAATAKEKKKKSGHYVLYLAMAAAAFICPVCFAIYFAIKANAVGIWAYAVTALVAAGVMTAIFVVFIPKYKECRLVIKNFRASGGELKKTSFIDAFCVGAVKVLFTVMTALLACFIPTLVTKCQGKTFGNSIKYAFDCLGSFWGMETGESDFFSFIIGMGLMALIFALILLLVKFVSKLLK